MERTKKIGVVALLESQGFDNIHQNLQLLGYLCSLIVGLRFLNQFLVKHDQSYLPVSILVGNANKI